MSKGFTLLEVLIALTLLSLMMGLLFTSISLGVSSWQKSETRLTELNQITNTYQVLQQYLSTALPLTNQQLKPANEINVPLSFQGEAQRLQFASNTRFGLQLFTLLQQKNQLMINVRSFFNPKANNTAQNIVLLNNINRLNLRYFGIIDPLKPAQWHKQWLKQNSQPIALSIQIELNNGKSLPNWVFQLKSPEPDFVLQPMTR